jgi:dTDP-4-amino-4,6-dideoxygalactose transaminase
VATPETSIPLLDLTPEIDELWDEIQAAVARVLRSGRFILGPEVTAFEQEVADYLGVKHAVGVNSGTDALTISLRSLGIGPGDEVITTPFTFVATAEAICTAGATPVFVDIDPDTFNIDPNRIEPAITERTKAILPVHLFGLAADMDPILAVAKRHSLRVMEDTAQAFGGRYKGRMLGTIGDTGAFSFFPSKNLGACGDGGLIATHDDGLADRARMLRAHGSRHKLENELIGYNSRLDEIQAALLRVKLPHVDRWNQQRRKVAGWYNAALAGIPAVSVPTPSANAAHVYHQFVVRAAERDELRQFLGDAAVATAVYYPRPLHRQPCFADREHHQGPLPAAELAAQQVLALPISPSLSAEQLRYIVDCIVACPPAGE